MKFDNQLRYAIQIIDTYQGDMPLHVWLKDFFRLNKQMGSRDRKLLSALVYSFYRLGHAVKQLPVDKRILAGLFLCTDQPNELLAYFRPDWSPKIILPLEEKIHFFQDLPEGEAFRLTDIFPWKEELSAGIDHQAFCRSFLSQPDLFLRIRPGHESAVRQKLDGIGEFIPPFTIRLPNGYKVEEHLTPDKEIVVQDYSSQRVAGFLKPGALTAGARPAEVQPAEVQPAEVQPAGLPTPEFFWDACAASGGKAIMTHDLYPGIDLTVSDIRDTIIRNLRARFKAAGIERYTAFLTDLSKQAPPASAANADLILADVPCTGSGTWGRTPEDLYFFDPEKILRYSTLQQKILANIAPHLVAGASLVYCTCSVFKKENEEMIAVIRDLLGVEPDGVENIKGYDQHADTLFAARFTR